MRETFEIGEIVTGIYKTGKYIGEVTNSRPGSYVVKVLAVLKHPVQGDLHNVKQADVPFFHERRALAFREQTNIPEQMVKKYEGEIPDYTDSLKLALETQMNSFSEDDSPFAVRSLETLEQLKKTINFKNKTTKLHTVQFGRYCVLTFFNTFEKSTSSPNVGGAGFTKYSLSFSTNLKILYVVIASSSAQ